MKATRWIVMALACGLAIPAAHAQKEAITDPAKAGPDFKVQGEYEGEVAGKGKFGAQVVALGGNKFDVYFLAGGLPGAGWDARTRTRVPAETKDEQTTLTGDRWSGGVADGKLTGKTADGDAFTLARVERKSPTLGAKPPEGATVLFDGKSAEQWENGKVVEENLLNCGTRSKAPFGVGKLHIEFRCPYQPAARGQGRGNSGVFVPGGEIQVLDSFGLNGENNECGAIYGKQKPAVNMCLPPLSWQTYDVEVKQGEGDTLLVTVWHNGVKVHEDFKAKGSPKGSPIQLQNHSNPVVYRNIWVAPLEAK
jgi:hypothetical protein